tara:strand:+ start:38 stop:316 length:279 start_codon:yes stop_codon:yes gene_type:complete
MALQKDFITYLSRRVVDGLAKRRMVEFPVDYPLQEKVLVVMGEELSVEYKINEESRQLLQEYSEYMRQTGVSYQEMFKMVKKKLVKEKKVIL